MVQSAHVLDDVTPYARYADGTLCWGCFTAIHPDLAKSKVRKEHFVLAELQRRCIDIFAKCHRTTWDCPVEGGCSLKRPDLALDFDTHAVVVEVDEAQHDMASCWDEDTRLAVIAADFKKPLSVIRLLVDAPVACFRRSRACNGEPTWEKIDEPFALLMSRTEAVLRKYAQWDPSVDDGDEVAQCWLTPLPHNA